jgi:hypothetical protein
MLAKLVAIPITLAALGSDPQTDGKRVDSVRWGALPAEFAVSIPGVAPATPVEAKRFANGFGIPQQRFGAKVFGQAGTAFALYGRKSGKLVSLYWAPADIAACPALAQQFHKALGKPSDVDKALSTSTWDFEKDGYAADLLVASEHCRVLLTPLDPFEFQ